MRKARKKSPAKSKKKSKKNPLKKYVGGGPTLGSSGFTPTYSTGPTVGSFYGNTTGFTPTTGTTFGGGTTFGSNNTFGSGTLGTSGFNTGSTTGNNNYEFKPIDFNQVNADLGFNPSTDPLFRDLPTTSAYSGTDRTLDSTITPEKKFDGKQEAREKIKEMGAGEYLKPEPKQMTKGEITSTALGAVPGTVGAIASLASSSKIDDPSNYYDKKTRGELERYNKKIKASSAASSVGSGLMATSAAWGPLAWIPAAAGAITMAASEGAKASYQAKQGNLGKSYDERVADRMAYKQHQADKKQQNLDRYSNMNYYGAGSGLARDGGLPKMKSGGPMLMEKYGVGGLSRVHGPTHEQGGIPVAFNSNPQDGGPQIVPEGMAEGEVENNEVIDQTDITQEILREGGVKSGTYMFSEHRGIDGKKGKNKKSPSYADARDKVEKMNLPRDMKKNVIRDLMNSQAKDTNKPERFGNGGLPKYQQAGLKKAPENVESQLIDLVQGNTSNSNNNSSSKATVPKGIMDPYTDKAWTTPGASYPGDPNFVNSNTPGATKWVHKDTGKTPFQHYLSQPSMQGRGRMASDTLITNDPRMFDTEGYTYPDGTKRPPPNYEEDPWKWGAPESRSADDAHLARAFEKTYGNLSSLLTDNPDKFDVNYKKRFIDPKQHDRYAPGGQKNASTNYRFKAKEAGKLQNGGLPKYTNAGILNTKTGQFLREYGPGMVNTIGEGINVGMNLSQKYNPVETINARELTADQINIGRATDTLKGSRESELIGAKRASRAVTGTGATQRENALRMTSLRAQEEAENAIRETNRLTASDEAKINLAAVQQADESNRQTDILRSESRRNEGLRKESFDNLRKKYIGSVASEWGKTAADQMLTKEYINRTLPPGVNMYEVNLNRAIVRIMRDNPKLDYLQANAKAMDELKAAKK